MCVEVEFASGLKVGPSSVASVDEADGSFSLRKREASGDEPPEQHFRIEDLVSLQNCDGG